MTTSCLSFIDALLGADQATIAPEIDLFGRLAGSWRLDICWFDRGRLVRRATGEWHFCIVLGGAAVQDVWIVPSREDRRAGAEPYEYGTSVRFYDPGLQAWRSTWIGPARGAVIAFIARGDGDEIVLEGRADDAGALRWVFSQITDTSFRWRNEACRSGGTAEIVQTFKARRMEADAPAEGRTPPP